MESTLDRAAVQLDQRLRDRQAEAGSADPLRQSRVAADEALEDVLQLLFGHSRPVVAHRDLHLGAGAVRAVTRWTPLRASNHAHW